MGVRYIVFRSMFEIKRRTGWLKSKFPINPGETSFITLDEWRRSPEKFFFQSREEIGVPAQPSAQLASRASRIFSGKHLFFNSIEYHLGNRYDWVTNPQTGFRYDQSLHWTQIRDFSKSAGDIKWVWEKSRFSWVYNILRYDHHFGRDSAGFVLGEILSWIDHNPINCGPNYRCSQEISLRVLNWTFALYFYRDSGQLSEPVFQKIMHHLYWQVKHVYDNIEFSRVAVRNNHAVTETATLYIAGLLFPFLPGASVWKEKGKTWFEKEIEYQVYPDGTFLQFSMNYHRVVVQVLTWVCRLSYVNHQQLAPVVSERVRETVRFLVSCINPVTGQLPNYGANDGALFFPLNDNGFADHRPQLQALAACMSKQPFENVYEDELWYGFTDPKPAKHSLFRTGTFEFNDGGYYVLREKRTLTFIRCGNHNDRPSQADNLHLDLFVDDVNVLRDGGTYSYNSDPEQINYFFGSASHNTVMLGNKNQMLKGERFIWYHWTQSEGAGWTEHEDRYEFNGIIRAFGYLDKKIRHRRTVKKFKGELRWEVEDHVNHNTGLPVRQVWNPLQHSRYEVNFSAVDHEGNVLVPESRKGWFSSTYQHKEDAQQIVFTTHGNVVKTIIEVIRLR